MEEQKLRKQLEKLAIHAVVAFASRAALRVLPILAMDKQLSFWPEEKKLRYLTGVCNAARLNDDENFMVFLLISLFMILF